MKRVCLGLTLLLSALAGGLTACGQDETVSDVPQGLNSSNGPAALSMAELPGGVRGAFGGLEVAVGGVVASTVGAFEFNDDTVFCVFRGGWLPASDTLLREFKQPYETASGISSYQLIDEMAACPAQTNAIFVAAFADPSVPQIEDGNAEYQLRFAAWQNTGAGSSTVFVATVVRDVPRDDAAGTLDTIGSEVSAVDEAALKMSQSLSADGIDMLALLAREVRAKRKNQ